MPAKKKFKKLITNSSYPHETTDKKELPPTSDTHLNTSSSHTYSFRPASVIKNKKGKVYAVGFIHVYIPFIAAFILSVINKFLSVSGAYDGFDSTLNVILQCIIYLLIFIVPIIVYCKLQKKSLHKELSLHRFSPSYAPFIIIGLILLIVVMAAEKIAISYFFPEAMPELYVNPAANGNSLGVILAYAVFPAVCEELFVRGLIQNGISEKAGGLTGIIVSSIAFALLHLDFRYFTVYLSAGLILAICAHVTNSVIPSIIIHIFNNLFSLSFSARLSFIASERTGNVFLIIILVFFAFILMLFYLKSLESLCIKKAYLEDVSGGTDTSTDAIGRKSRMHYRKPFTLFSSSGYSFHKLLRVLFSPALIIAAVLFMFAAI